METANKKKKPQLKDQSPEELLAYCRKLRNEKRELREQLEAAEVRLSELELSERSLRASNIELESSLEARDAEIESLKQELETATVNATKLQGIIESDDDTGLISNDVGGLIVDRLDSIIFLLGGPATPQELDDGEEPAEDDEDFGDDERDVSGYGSYTQEDLSDDEDEDAEEEAPPLLPLEGPILLPEDHSTIPIHGVDVDNLTAPVTSPVLPEPEAEHDVNVSDDTLADVIVPQIKQTVDSFEGYADIILAAVQSGDMSKELALRQVVAKAYPEHAEMAETILSTQITRDKVYEVMGL